MRHLNKVSLCQQTAPQLTMSIHHGLPAVTDPNSPFMATVYKYAALSCTKTLGCRKKRGAMHGLILIKSPDNRQKSKHHKNSAAA